MGTELGRGGMSLSHAHSCPTLLCCQATAELYMLAKYLMELTLVDYDMVHYNPSEIAAAALCLSQKVFSQGHWVSLHHLLF